MIFITDTRVRETSVTTGAGDYTLAGAPTGYQPFSTLGANNACPYWASDGNNFEEGIGTILSGPARLQRTHVMKSSNGGAAVNWGPGTRDVVCGPIASLAFPRIVTKSVAGGVDVVLTQLEQRCAGLVLTGALTGNINVITDDTPWNWVIYNNTSGAFTVTIKTAAGAGKSIAQGKRGVLLCDGVNIVGALDDPALSGAEPAFPSVTTRMLFQQTGAPPGWVKETSAVYHESAIRIVTSGVATGGSDNFSSVFSAGKQTDSTTLTTTQIPPHLHNITMYQATGGGNAAASAVASASTTWPTATDGGGGGGHTHGAGAMNIKFTDLIIATKG